MKQCKLKIAIIDDGINMELLCKLRNKKTNISCLQIQKNVCVAQYIHPTQPINHGTICTAILIETLESLGISEDIELISISILGEEKQNKLQKLSEAIQWAIDHKVNLISLSIGSKEFTGAGEIIKVSKKAKRKNTIIVAAGANDGMITYPACLPSVIGVKAGNFGLEESIYDNPADGIDIQANIPKLHVLKTLERDFNYYLTTANSLLAPVVTGQIADILLKEEKIHDIRIIKELLAKEKNLKIIKDNYGYLPLRINAGRKKTEEIPIPVIAMEYHPSNKEDIENLTRALQQEFIKNEYNCVCISDMILENYFEENRFRLPVEHKKERICFYGDILNASVILLIIEEKNFNSSLSFHFIDAIISEKIKCVDCPSYHLKMTDTDLVSSDLFKWIIKLFYVQDEDE